MHRQYMYLRGDIMNTNNNDNEPRGTWALLCLVAVAMTLGWLFLYYGVFLARGTLH